MKYRVTCLTPTLVGDGQKLAPIDYMVWKDHVNVLDQRRIFRLLSKGPRLEGYLDAAEESRQAGFRVLGRIRAEFRGPADSVRTRQLDSVVGTRPARKICSFRPLPRRPRVPICPRRRSKAPCAPARYSIAGPKTPCATSRSRMEDDRPPRNPAAKAEDAVLGGRRRIACGGWRRPIPRPVTYTGMKIYLLRDVDHGRARRRQVRAGLEIAARTRRRPARSTTALRCSPKWRLPGWFSKVCGRETSAHDRAKTVPGV